LELRFVKGKVKVERDGRGETDKQVGGVEGFEE
jgi:hypothetical protein